MVKLGLDIRLCALSMALVSALVSTATEPDGYYARCEGLKGASLLSELCDVVGPHTTISYDGLWEIYPDTDSDADGLMWDMYSTKRWTWSNSNRCGNYKYVGDCCNREHSMPKSWFGNASPMYSDAFHLYPTDGKVNGQRSNHPYGECANGTRLPSNGGVEPLGRLGNSTFPGYEGTVFEPDDEYKGDFARTYFYMAAAYNSRIGGWSSPMLAGNSYPAFTDWSVELLLKWHRQDPVSPKELARNEAVYGHQHNRNPFIDHPELAEHIWGDKKTVAWTSGETDEPAYVIPLEGQTFDIGTISAGVTRYYELTVRGVNMSGTTSVSVSGEGFKVYPATLTATRVNEGATVTVSALAGRECELEGSLVLTCGALRRTARLTARVMNGLPALEAADITEESFVARWVNVDPNGGVNYQLHVELDGNAIDGYPVDVAAEDECYTVADLLPETTYTYYLTSPDLRSNTVSVTTAAPGPEISLIYDGYLMLETEPDHFSDAVEIGVEAENISGSLVVDVDAPFEVSTDKSAWGESVTLVPGEDYFYLRLNGFNEDPGFYTTSIRLSARNCFYDEVTASGRIRAIQAMTETFESGNWVNSYSNGQYEGVSGTWDLNNCGVYESDSFNAYESSGCARFGKSSGSSIAMLGDTYSGIGTISFVGRPWTGDADAVIEIEYSLDGGAQWSLAGKVTLPRGSEYREYSADVLTEGQARLRLRQSSGSRVLIDNIKATAYEASTLRDVSTSLSRSWDAFCRDGRLVVEVSGPTPVVVYAIDASTRFNATVSSTQALTLAPGLYIVVSGDLSKRVIVK